MDTEGLLLMPYVSGADLNDRPGLENMFAPLCHKFQALRKLWVDMGYQSKDLKEKASKYGVDLEVVKRPASRFWVPGHIEDVEGYLKSCGIDISRGFKVLPRRWVVERTFAWIGRYRRMSKDYEFLPHTQEAFIYLALTKTMLRRILKCQNLI